MTANPYRGGFKPTKQQEAFVATKMREIHAAVTAVAYELGPENPVAIGLARGWDFMRAGVLRAMPQPCDVCGQGVDGSRTCDRCHKPVCSACLARERGTVCVDCSTERTLD